MKKILLATVSVLALSAAARAADMPAKARTYVPDSIPLWTGGYLGILGGVARHDASFKDFTCAFDCGTLEGNKTGGAIGGLVGYNWQHGNFVYGVEGDWNWVGAKSSTQRVIPADSNASYDVSWVATVRGRAGLAVDSTLVYITGGAAFGHVKNSLALINFDGSTFVSFIQDETKVGWAAGVGVEHMFSSHWTARAEFRYVDLGTTGVSCAVGIGNNGDCSPYRGEFSNTLMMGLVGLNYKF